MFGVNMMIRGFMVWDDMVNFGLGDVVDFFVFFFVLI